MSRFDKLVSLFGSGSEIARVCGVNRSAVSRWRDGTYMPGIDYQVAILKEARRRKFDVDEVAEALDVDRCNCCGAPLDHAIRRALR